MTIANARALVGQQIGLSNFDGSVAAYRDLSAADQIRLTQALFAFIRSNPQEFTEQQQQTVQVEGNRVASLSTQDPSSWSVFVDAITDEALRVGSSVASVGNGVITSVNLVGTLLPLAVIVAVAVFAWPYIKHAKDS